MKQDWLSDAIEQVGTQTSRAEEEARIAYRVFDSQRRRAEEAARANEIARATGAMGGMSVPPETVQRNLPRFEAEQRARRAGQIIGAAPKLQPWLAQPRNAAAAVDDIEPLGAFSMWFGPAASDSLPGATRPAFVRELREQAFRPRSGQQLIEDLRGTASREAMRLADIDRRRPGSSFGSWWSGLATDTVEGFKQSYYGTALYLLDAMGAGSPDNPNIIDPNAKGSDGVFRYYQDAAERGRERALANRPVIASPTGQAVYGGLSSLAQMAPALLAAPFTDGVSLLTLIAAQTGSSAYGKYRTRGATRNEALVGGVAEGAIEGVTEALPLGFLTSRFGKEGIGAFLGGYLVREMGTEQLATLGQDAVDTAIANPNKTWADYWAERPRAAFDTAVATVIAGGAITGASGVARAFRRDRKEVSERLEALAGAKFIDQAVGLGMESKLAKRDPEGFAQFVQAQAEGTPVENVFVPADAVQSFFQGEGRDYRADPFWSQFAEQIDQASAIGGDVVVPIGQAVSHFSQGNRWETWRDSVRLSPGGMSLAEARSIEQSYAAIMEQRGQEAADFDRALREQQAPAQRVYDEVLSQARQSGKSLNAARAYADLYAARYAARAAQRGTDAWTLFNDSVAGIVTDLPEALRPYEQADELDRLVNVMRREKAAASEATLRGPSLLEWISLRGGIEDRGGDIASMGGARWHLGAPFRRKLIKETSTEQGDMLGSRGSSANSPDILLQDAIDAGYFPELLDRSGGYDQLAGVDVLLDAIDRELRGDPVYAAEMMRDGGIATDAKLRGDAAELRSYLELRGIDPDEAPLEAIRAAVNEVRGGPVSRTFEQMRAWDEPPPGMSDIVLHHNGPQGLPRGRPQGMMANYFGTAEFSDAMGSDFGPWRYTFWVPQETADLIVDIGAGRGGEGGAAGRAFAAAVARRTYPEDVEFAEALERGDADAFSDFYELWADSSFVAPVLADMGYQGARFDEEYLLLPEAIADLVDRRMGPDDGTVSFYQSQPEHPPFYSALLQTVATSKTAKASAEQWKATILNAPGVKAEEVEWSGLIEWLDEQPGAVSRTDIEQFVRSGGIRVSEIVLGSYDARAVEREAERLYDAWVERHTLQILSDADDMFPGLWETVEETEDGFVFDGWTYETLAEAEEARADAEADAEREWERDQRRRIESDVRDMRDVEDFEAEAKLNVGAVTQFAEYTSTGEATETYRELLITLPLGQGRNPKKAPDTHWDQPGVVAHVRFQGKRDAEGRPVLFVEEVQSDWHQKGRDQGYAIPRPEELARASEAVEQAVANQRAAQERAIALGARLDLLPADEPPAPERGFDGFVLKDQPLDERASYAEVALRLRVVRDMDGEGFSNDIRAEADKVVADLRTANLRVTEAEVAYRNALEGGGIPDAPFKTTWPALVMKRVIRWAADNGYASVAWTTGDQQAERYSLSEAVGFVRAAVAPDGGFDLIVEKTAAARSILDNGMATRGSRGDMHMTREQLDVAFGREIGAKLAEGAEGAGGQFFSIEGEEDLRVGGEGMRAFYDRNLVNIANNLIKKYGAKVSRVSVVDPTPRADQMLADAEVARRDADALAGVDDRRAERLYGDANSAERGAAAMREAATTEQWGFDVTPKMAEAAKAGFSLFQGGESKPRARIDFQRDGRAVIRLFEGHDLSSLLHESGHLWLEELRADALAADAPEQVRADWETVRRWFESEGHRFAPGARIPVEAHEMWARGMERYFMEGKAPTPALQSAFASFRAWLLRIYKLVVNLNAPLTDDVRRVMDRMLATETELAQAEAEPGAQLLFKSAAEAGMTDAEFAAYEDSMRTVRTEAFDALLFKTMEAIRRERTAEWKRNREAVRREVEEQVRNRPEFRALALLRGRGGQRVQLNREAFVNEYGSDAVVLMPRGIPPTIVESGGVHPDVLAEMSGFRTGGEMVDMLMGIERRQRELRVEQDRRSVLQETIDIGTDASMLERYGDLLNDGSIEEEALAAINSDKASERIATEIRLLTRRDSIRRGLGDQVPSPVNVVRQWAQRTVREGKVGEQATAAALARHQRNEAKAAREAEDALRRGDEAAALVAKQRQLHHRELWRAAKAAKDQVDVIVRRMGKYAKARSLPSMDPDYLDRIHDLLEAFDFKPRSRRDRAERVSFGAWVAAREAEGEEVFIPPRLADFQRTNFKDVTVDDLVGLDDAVQSIAHLGRRKKKLLLAKEEAELEDVVAEAVAQAESLPARQFTADRNQRPDLRSRARGIDAALVKMEFLADHLDNGNVNGVFNRLLVQGSQEAANEKQRLLDTVLKPLASLYTGMSKAQQRRMRERVVVPELMNRNPETLEETPTVFERSEILTIALNVGNESNFSKLVRGESRGLSDANAWTAEKVMAVLDREMNEADWQFVQAVWREIDSLWPHVVRAEREITGIKPEKVEPRIVQTKFGAINGGYFPVVYDPTRSAMAEANYEDDAVKMMGQMGRVVSTPKGHTITRTEAAAPLMLSLEGVLFNHVNRVATRIAYGRWVRDTLKFVGHAKIRDLIDRKLGREYRQQIKPWLHRQVNDAAMDTMQLAAIDRLMRKFRVNATLVGLGFRFTTMLAQVGGLAVSAREVGPKYLALGAADMARNFGQLRDFVFTRSPMMAERATDFDRDVRQFFQNLSEGSGALDKARAAAFWGIGNIQLFVVDMPTWFGGYRRALDEGMSEPEAIAFADKAVRRSQSSGRAADLSALQGGSEAWRVMTLFYSYWNVQYNQQREAIHAARAGDWRKAASTTFWVLMVAPVVGAFLTGDWPDEESEESWFLWAMRKMFFGLWMGVPVIRDVMGTVERKVMGKPSFSATTPIVRAFDELMRPGSDLLKVAQGDEPSDRWLQNAITAPGYFVGLPTGQVGATAQYLYDWAIGEQQPEDAGDVAKGVIKGPQKDQEQ